LKKRTKKLLLFQQFGAVQGVESAHQRQETKVFWFFFSKKNGLPYRAPRYGNRRLMLIPAIALLGVVVLAGLALGGLYMMLDEPPAGLTWKGALHGAGGAAGFALLVVALRQTPPSAHAAKMGVSGFGAFSATLIGIALVFGLFILARHLLGRTIPLAVVASHGLLAIVGYTLLVTYLTMLH
jgi:hypothetical protein